MITAKYKSETHTLSKTAWAKLMRKPPSSVIKTFRRLEIAGMNPQEMVDYISAEGTKWTKKDSKRSPARSLIATIRNEEEIFDRLKDETRDFFYPARVM